MERASMEWASMGRASAERSRREQVAQTRHRTSPDRPSAQHAKALDAGSQANGPSNAEGLDRAGCQCAGNE